MSFPDSIAAGHARHWRASAVLTNGFRPFFLAAALWAAAALGVWMLVFRTGLALPSRFAPLDWHIHEMLFGFVMAAVAGFLLTAIPNWTRRLPVSGAPLAVLAGLWLMGRIACLVSAWLPAWTAVAADLAFPVALAFIVAREIIAARNRRNFAIILPVTVLGIANLLMHLEALGVGIAAGLGWRLGLAAILVLVSVIAGRIVPGFTRNWLAARHIAPLPAQHGLADRLALGTLHAGLFGWALFAQFAPLGWLLIAGGACNLWRLARWQGVKTTAEPLVTVLHLAYGWIGVGAGLLGASMLTKEVPQSAGIHAMTVGAIGMMILAVMTRATRGHTGRPLTSSAGTNLLYGCVMLAAMLRVVAAFGGPRAMMELDAAAALWIAGFVLFLVHYAPMLLLPRVQR
jgi:uncharacterized protein involved in response to NO